MKKAIRDHAIDFAAIIGLLLIATVVGGYILNEQRLRFPLIEEEPFRMRAELIDAHGVRPGQGQSVDVAGVRIGEIAGIGVENGRAVADLEIKREFRDLIRTDAAGLLRPRTGLKDMFLQLDPGTPGAPEVPEGFTIPVKRTLPDVDLDEILAALDTDTRDYLRLFLNGTGRALRGEGDELAEVFKRFGPTFRDLRRVNQAVATERVALRRLVSSLAELNEELATKDDDLAGLVSASAGTFRALASEERNLSATVSELPPTLRQATDTLGNLESFAGELRPAAQRLVPVFRALESANRQVQPFAREAAPILRRQIRPFVRAARPVTRNLAPAASGLGRAAPELTRSFRVLNRLFNMLGHNKDGREAPDDPDRDEGYMFWLSWVTHQTVNLLNVEDANGPMRPLFLTGTCDTLATLVENEPALEFIENLSPVLATVCGNPQTASVDLQEVRRRIAKSRGDR